MKKFLAGFAAAQFLAAAGIAWAADASPEAAAFETEFQSATKVPALEALLVKYANSDVAKPAVVKLEDILIADIDANGIGSRYAIGDIKPAQQTKSRITIVTSDGHTDMSLLPDMPGDGIAIWNGNAAIPVGAGTVHRIKAALLLKASPPAGGLQSIENGEPETAGYKLVNKGDNYHRLTFYMSEKYGYVYLRGEGEVIPPGGGAAIMLTYIPPAEPAVAAPQKPAVVKSPPAKHRKPAKPKH